jgi:hypothetical protein
MQHSPISRGFPSCLNGFLRLGILIDKARGLIDNLILAGVDGLFSR